MVGLGGIPTACERWRFARVEYHPEQAMQLLLLLLLPESPRPAGVS